MAGIEFLINIQQRINAGTAVSELQRTSNALKAAQDRYTELDSAARKAEQAVSRNAAAQAAANATAAKAKASGDDKGYERAAAAADRLRASQEGLQSAASQAKAALDQQATEVDKLANAYIREKNAADKVRDQKEAGGKREGEDRFDSADLAVAGRALGRFGGPLGEVGREVGGLARGWNKLAQTIGTGPAIFAAGVVGIVALGVAVAALTIKFAELAFTAANAAREVQITMQAMAGSAAGGKALGDAIDQVNLKTGLGADRLLELTRSLQEAGVPANNIPTALRAIAEQESALGNSSGTQKLIDKLKTGQESVAQLGKEMDTQFGDLASKRAIGFDASIARLKSNIAGLFSGLDMEGILGAFHRLVELFDKNTVAGKGLKQLIEALFGPFTKGADGAGVALERLFIKAEIGLFDIVIALKQAENWIRKTFKTDQLIDWQAALTGIKIILGACLVSVVAIGAAVALVVGLAVASFAAFGAAVKTVSDVVDNVKSAFNGGDWEEVGKNIVEGIAKGITKGGPAAIGAATGVVGLVIDAANTKSDSHSPSRVFERHGFGLMQGEAIGIEKGADQVESAINDAIPSTPNVSVKATRGGGGNRVGELHLHFHGLREEGLLEAVERKMADVLEKLDWQVAAEPEPEVA
jgi:hypothetical protein